MSDSFFSPLRPLRLNVGEYTLRALAFLADEGKEERSEDWVKTYVLTFAQSVWFDTELVTGRVEVVSVTHYPAEQRFVVALRFLRQFREHWKPLLAYRALGIGDAANLVLSDEIERAHSAIGPPLPIRVHFLSGQDGVDRALALWQAEAPQEVVQAS